MRVYLDDEREIPEGWVRVYWPNEAIELLKTGEVVEISLDHDLGDDERGTGYDVVLWIEEAVATTGFEPPVIKGPLGQFLCQAENGAGHQQHQTTAVDLGLQTLAYSRLNHDTKTSKIGAIRAAFV